MTSKYRRFNQSFWNTSQGQGLYVHEMTESHIVNSIKYMKENAESESNTPYDRALQDHFLPIMENELLSREGEKGNRDNLTISQIMEARRLKRLLLGLPPIPNEDQFSTFEARIPPPKESLFK